MAWGAFSCAPANAPVYEAIRPILIGVLLDADEVGADHDRAGHNQECFDRLAPNEYLFDFTNSPPNSARLNRPIVVRAPHSRTIGSGLTNLSHCRRQPNSIGRNGLGSLKTLC